MKKSIILTLVLVFFFGTFSSCARKCKGAGWYGKRNIGYVPQKNEAIDLASIDISKEECGEARD